MVRGALFLVSGTALMIETLHKVRGRRVRPPRSTEDKVWRALLILSSVLLVVVGVWFLTHTEIPTVAVEPHLAE